MQTWVARPQITSKYIIWSKISGKVANEQKLMNHNTTRYSAAFDSTITNNNFPDAIFVHDSVSHGAIKLFQSLILQFREGLLKWLRSYYNIHCIKIFPNTYQDITLSISSKFILVFRFCFSLIHNRYLIWKKRTTHLRTIL